MPVFVWRLPLLEASLRVFSFAQAVSAHLHESMELWTFESTAAAAERVAG